VVKAVKVVVVMLVLAVLEAVVRVAHQALEQALAVKEIMVVLVNHLHLMVLVAVAVRVRLAHKAYLLVVTGAMALHQALAVLA
jgi:hypothetical protein